MLRFRQSLAITAVLFGAVTNPAFAQTPVDQLKVDAGRIKVVSKTADYLQVLGMGINGPPLAGASFASTAAMTFNVGGVQQLALSAAGGVWHIPNASGSFAISDSGVSALGANSTCVGYGCDATAANSTVLGNSAQASFSSCISLGGGASCTAANQWIVGSDSAPITSFSFGRGRQSATPDGTISFSPTTGLGTNIIGSSLRILSGRGTGTGTGGGIILSIPLIGSSGSTLQSFSDSLTIPFNRPATIFAVNDSGRLAISDSGVSTLGASATTYGYLSDATGLAATAVGHGAQATGNNGTAVGFQSLAGTAASATAIGHSASANGGNSVAAGASSSAAGGAIAVGSPSTAAQNAIAIGTSASASTDDALALGRGAVAGHAAIALGRLSATTAANQLVAGSPSVPVSSLFFGSGVTAASPVGTTINGTGGSGTDIAGASLTLAGGRGTGTGAGGSLLLQTAPAGSTGTTLNTLVTRGSIDSTGRLDYTGVMSQKVHTGFAGSDAFARTNAVTTTNATQTTLETITLADNTVYYVEVSIPARESTGTDRAYYRRAVMAYRQGGGATLGTIDTPFTDESAGALLWDVTFTTSGNDVRVSVTGAAATTVYWAATTKYQGVNTN